jgi:hypothetical protein
MHEWGDEWFENNGEQLYAAINFIESFLRKHHIVIGEKKNGVVILTNILLFGMEVFTKFCLDIEYTLEVFINTKIQN